MSTANATDPKPTPDVALFILELLNGILGAALLAHAFLPAFRSRDHIDVILIALAMLLFRPIALWGR